MTADLNDQVQEVLIVPSCSDAADVVSSSPRKDAPNPQQGMADPAAASTNTACTSPLTVTSLEAAAAANAAGGADPSSSSAVGGEGTPVEKVEAMLSSPMANLGLEDPSSPEARLELPAPAVNSPALDDGEKTSYNNHHQQHYHRPLPTVHDNRKLFVGGLPTDGE